MKEIVVTLGKNRGLVYEENYGESVFRTKKINNILGQKWNNGLIELELMEVLIRHKEEIAYTEYYKEGPRVILKEDEDGIIDVTSTYDGRILKVIYDYRNGIRPINIANLIFKREEKGICGAGESEEYCSMRCRKCEHWIQ